MKRRIDPTIRKKRIDSPKMEPNPTTLTESKIWSNKAVDTTAANARLFDDATSKSTNPDVVAMTEAAVVSP
jgi:hypothetical protein